LLFIRKFLKMSSVEENDNSPITKFGRKVQKPVLFTPETKKSQPDPKRKSSINKSSGKSL